MFKTRKNIRPNYTPLVLSYSLVSPDNVAHSQSFNAATGIYEPDYTMIPLVLEPRISGYDYDNSYKGGDLAGQLYDIQWWRVYSDGTQGEITSVSFIAGATAGCEILTEAKGGHPKGTLIVHENQSAARRCTYVMTAKLRDPRGAVTDPYPIRMSQDVECVNANRIPTLQIDAPLLICFNPLRDFDDSNPATKRQVIHALMTIDGVECDPDMTLYQWEVLRNHANPNSWSPVDVNCTNYMDIELSISDGGKTITVNKELVKDLRLRIRACYDPEGNPIITDASPTKRTRMLRKMIVRDAEIGGIPDTIPPGITQIVGKAYVFDSRGLLKDPSKELDIKWKAATNNAATGNSYTQVASGDSMTINPQDKLNPTRGAIMELDIDDRGPWGLMADGDGKYIVDGDGKYILIR